VKRPMISPTCEVVMEWHSVEPVKFCGLATVAGYATMDGGWMALCAVHVGPHESYAIPAEDIRSGIAEAMMANGSRG
jgi:hypothetical protein